MKSCQLLRLVASVFVFTVLSSCNNGFRTAWKNAPVSSGVSGKWQGTWQSAVNGHHGALRCVVGSSDCVHEKVPAGARSMQCFYHATWMKILSGSYKAGHNVQRQNDGSYIFKGEHKMPDWAGGLYRYHGTIKGDLFNACYECAKDRGTYTMKRVR